MDGAEIDSEAKKNEVVTTLNGYTNHCVVIMEQGPIELDAAAPRWRISASLTIHDLPSDRRIIADLPFILIPPLIHTRQVVAVAKIPMTVVRWTFRFECDEVRANAKVWLFPGTSTSSECGIFRVPHG
jgi:hypothetical protein